MALEPVFHGMSRKLRHLPPNSLVEVTTRTVESRFLLRPSERLNEIVVGVLARAHRLYDVEVCAPIWLSNHNQMLLVAADAGELSGFMGYVNGNVARELNRLLDRRHQVWSRRFDAIPVSDDEHDQVARLRYLLAHGCKEGLVSSPLEWPGVHAAHALLTGEPLKGLWFNRTREYQTGRRKGEKKVVVPEEETLDLAFLPCWRGLPEEEVRSRIGTMIADIERETAERHRRAKTRPIGVKKIRAQDPRRRPASTKRSPAPRFHASRPEVRRYLETTYREFCRAFRQAAEDLKNGHPDPEFPLGSFPPGLPFVRGQPSFSVC